MSDTKGLHYILALIFLIFLSCQKDPVIEPDFMEYKSYLHLSHTRTDANPFMDAVAEKIDYSQFDMLWLGGDLALLTSADDPTMSYVDSIYHLGDANTLWSLGNHDYSDLNRIEQFTQRPAYYSSNQDGITIVVLDTQNSTSHITGTQRDLLFAVLDTLQESSHLIILHHKLIWMYDSDLESQVSSVSNAEIGPCFHCINPNNFNSEIYPKLVEIQQSGIEVLCIGGDIGNVANEFQHITSEGIHFLASGIKNGEEDNKALLFHHNLTDNSLTWSFELLSDL